MSLADSFEEYIQKLIRDGASPQSIKSYRNTYKKFIEHLKAENYSGAAVDNTSVESFLGQYTNPETYNKMLAHIRAWAKHDTLPKVGKFLGHLDLANKKINLDLPITVNDMDRDSFMAALGTMSQLAWAHATLMIHTGLRFNEVRALRRSHYFDDQGIPAVKFRGKGRQERIVPLNTEALAAYRIWSNTVHKEGVPHENTLRYYYHKAEKAAGVRIKPHWFRHTVATKLLNLGTSYDDIADILGNTVEVVRSRYAKTNTTKLGSIMARLT
jgi:site-specific recombinase XerD